MNANIFDGCYNMGRLRCDAFGIVRDLFPMNNHNKVTRWFIECTIYSILWRLSLGGTKKIQIKLFGKLVVGYVCWNERRNHF
jgi:hypothetical protein